MENRFEEVDQLKNGTRANKIIELRSIYKDGKHTVQPAFDQKSGWYAGVERLSDEEKKERRYYVTVGETGERARNNTKLRLENGTIFDLSDPRDTINWEWVKHLPCVAMSYREAQMGKALFYVHIEGREAEERIKLSDMLYEAMKLVKEDPKSNHVNRALLLGFDMEGEEPATVEDLLLDIAKKTPEKIFRIYRDKSMKIHLLFEKALKGKHVSLDAVNGVYMFGSTILGISKEASIAFLQQNEDLLELLERDVNPEYFKEKMQHAKTLTPAERANMAREAKKAVKED